MKAVVYYKYGSPDILRFEEIEKPVPRENQVLVRVRAASVNSWDWDLLTGRPLIYRLLFGLTKPKHLVIGCDIAGVVEAVGKDVAKFKPGDDVLGDISADGFGAFAEYACANENHLALKPGNLSFEEAAAIPQAGVLALQGLRKGKIQKGSQVLINGAGGGVGSFAIQMAKLYGAEVTGVDKTSKIDFMFSLGADKVIDYTKIIFTKNDKLYDLVLDVTAHHSVIDYSRILKPKGVYVMVGGSVKSILQAAFLGSIISKINKKKIGILAHKPDSKDISFVTELAEKEKIKLYIDRRYPLNETADALRFYSKGDVKGKIIININ